MSQCASRIGTRVPRRRCERPGAGRTSSGRFDMNDASERWLPVVGYEGLYEVSDLGRVRSLERRSAARNRWNQFERRTHGRVLAQRLGKRGYLLVSLWRDGKRKNAPVHRLVSDAFIELLPAGMDRRHGPGGGLDNRLQNLSHGTRSDNERDKTRDGTMVRGSGKPNAKLTDAIVRECRQRYTAGGVSYATLAAEFGVSYVPMRKAIRRETWKHVAS